MENKDVQKSRKTSDREYYLFALRIIGDFGATIAVPVVAFSMFGKYLDNKYHHGPLFLIIGFVVSALLSGKMIYDKAKKYGAQYQNMGKK